MENKNLVISFSLKTIFLIIGTVISLWLLVTLKEIIILVLISLIFSSAMDPTVDKLEKKKIPRPLAIAGMYLLVVLFLVLVFRSIIPPAVAQFSSLADNKEIYVDKIGSYLHSLSPSLVESFKTSALNILNSFVKPAGLGFLSGAADVFNGFISFLVVLVISFYFLLQKDGTEKFITSYVPKIYQSKALSIAKKITGKMSLWFRGQLLLGLIIFAVTFIGLSVLKVKYALTLAIIAGFLELVPLVGPIVAGALGTLVALTSSPLLALIVFIFYFLVQQLENHVLVPVVMKKTLGLHPVTIIVALLAGGKLLGFLGIIISVPIAAALSVLFNELYKNKIEEK